MSPDQPPATVSGLDVEPSAALLAASTAVSRAIEQAAAQATDLDTVSLDLLVRLGLAGSKGLRVVDLGEQLLRSPSHVSRVVERAMRRGLVTRSVDLTDRRAKIVQLTAVGDAELARFVPVLSRVLDATFHATLEAYEAATLAALLRRVESAARVVVRTP